MALKDVNYENSATFWMRGEANKFKETFNSIQLSAHGLLIAHNLQVKLMFFTKIATTFLRIYHYLFSAQVILVRKM